MGLLDVFRRKPAWQKSYDNALEEIKDTADPDLILRVATETAFGERESETLAIVAADRIWEMKNKSSGAKEALERLAREVSSAVARCHASWYLRSRDSMKQWIAQNIVAAYGQLGSDDYRRPRDTAAWMECVTDDATLVAAFDAACKQDHFRYGLYDHLHGNHLLSKLFWAVKDERIQEELVGRISGSHEEYERIARESESARCVTAAIDHLNADSPVLRQLAEQGHNGAFRRLKQLGREDVVVELADGGNLVAQKYLTFTRKSQYGKRYESSMRDDLRERAMAADPRSTEGAKLIGQAVASEALPEEKLEKIALTWELNGTTGRPWDAMRQIKDPDRLARLLLERKCALQHSHFRQVWNEWGEALVGRLWNREDVLLRCILETDYDVSVKRKALKHIEDPEKLTRIAMEDHILAPEAAQRLPKNKLAPVRNSKNPQAAKLGQTQHHRNRVSKAGEAELREIMAWELGNSDSPDTYLNALARMEDQAALLGALRAWLGTGRRYGITREDKPWKDVGRAILERITDGPGLADVCLERPGVVDAGISARLKQLIGGTEAEADFSEGARQWMLDHLYDWRRCASMLRLYYDLPDDWQALWRFGGPEFVRRVLASLQGAKEYESAMDLGRILADLYRNVPESHASLEREKGRRYSKHVDFIDESCMGNSRNYDKDYVLKL